MRNNQAAKIAAMIRAFDAQLPLMVNDMGQTALNHFTQSFPDQGFTDEHVEPWQPRKHGVDPGRGILIGRGTANLRKLRKQNIRQNSVGIFSNAAAERYARVHNEGLRSGRGRGFIMTERRFAAYSGVMDRKIKAKINRRVMSIIR